MKKIFIYKWVCALFVCILIVFAVIQIVFAQTENIKTTANGGVFPAAALQNGFIEVAKKVGPAVVSISTIHTEKVGIRRYHFGGPQSPFEDELFERFFRDFFEGWPEEREFQQRGLGSGVIIDGKGLILTNEHVVRGADKITVTLSDGRQFNGQIKGADPHSDLAVIKIDAKGLLYAELGDSDEVKIGQWSV